MFWQPNLREMQRLRREMNRLFESGSQRGARRSGGFPSVNIWMSEEEGAMVTAELPGVDPDSLDISVTGDTLTLSGSRQAAEDSDDLQYHRQERRSGEFARTVQLPFAVNRDGVEASMNRGILEIRLPRAEAEKPRQISVKAGQ